MDIKDQGLRIEDAFIANWANDNTGTLEELVEKVQLLSDGLGVALALLVNNKQVTETELKGFLAHGWQIRAR